MVFSKAFPLTLVDDVSVVSAAQLMQIDLNQSRAIDGTGGGTYTPSADIKIVGPNSIEMQGTTKYKYASRTLYRNMPLVFTMSTGTWQYTGGAVSNIQNTAIGYIDIPLYCPMDQVLDSVTVGYQGAVGHGSDPVTGGITMPYFEVTRRSFNGTLAVIGTGTDNVTTRALYQAHHFWTLGTIGATLDTATYSYFLRFYSESGVDFQAAANLTAVKLGFIVTSQPEV